jgi:hypothetical protein
MARGRRPLLALIVLVVATNRAWGCEPVIPFLQVTVPALALTGSFLVLFAAVLLKSALFALFEKTPSASSCSSANVSRECTDESYRPARCSDDCKFPSDQLAHRSALGLLAMLAAIEEACRGGQRAMADVKIACDSRRNHDYCVPDELYFIHGGAGRS